MEANRTVRQVCADVDRRDHDDYYERRTRSDTEAATDADVLAQSVQLDRSARDYSRQTYMRQDGERTCPDPDHR